MWQNVPLTVDPNRDKGDGEECRTRQGGGYGAWEN